VLDAAGPLAPEQLEHRLHLREVQRLRRAHDVEGAREAVGAPAVVGGRQVAREVERRAVALAQQRRAQPARREVDDRRVLALDEQPPGLQLVEHRRHERLEGALAAHVVEADAEQRVDALELAQRHVAEELPQPPRPRLAVLERLELARASSCSEGSASLRRLNST
jgi:hypothetical protein